MTTGENSFQENDPSLDPRDPRGEDDPIFNVSRAIGKVEPGDFEAKRDLLMELISGHLRSSTERQELTAITDGMTSEDAARRVRDALDMRIMVLKGQVQSLESLRTELDGLQPNLDIPGQQGPEAGAGDNGPSNNP